MLMKRCGGNFRLIGSHYTLPITPGQQATRRSAAAAGARAAAARQQAGMALPQGRLARPQLARSLPPQCLPPVSPLSTRARR